MRLSLTNNLMALLVLASVNAQAQSLSVTRRGTDVGNGGDPVRELFNTARIYSGFVMSRVNDGSPFLREADLGPEIMKKILPFKTEIEHHIRNDLHRWGRYDFSECSGLDLSELDAVQLDYRTCAEEYTDAAQATCELIRITLVKSTLLSLEEAKLASDTFCEKWSALHSSEWRTAGSVRLKHLDLVGRWRSDSPPATARVFPEGVLRLIKQFPGAKLSMVNFLNWQADQGYFTTTGVLTCPMASLPRSLNTVTEDTCRVPVRASVKPYPGEGELEVELMVPDTRPESCRCPSPGNLIWRFYMQPDQADKY